MATARHSREVQPTPRRGDEDEPEAPNALPLGRILIDAGAAKKEAVDAALAVQRKTFRPLGRILREEHGLSVEALADALRKQDHQPRVFLRFFPIEPETLRLLDRKLCAEQELAAFERLGNLLCVAISNPSRRDLILQLRSVTEYEIAAFRAPWEDIQKALKDFS